MQIKDASARSLWRTWVERISCHNFVLSDGYAYFSNWSYNGLFQTEIRTGETLFLGSFEGESLSELFLHWELFLRDGKIYFLPRRGRHMHVYTMSDGSMDRVEIRSSSEGFFRIGEAILGERCVAFLPEEKGYPARKVDLEAYRVTDIDSQEKIQGERLIQRGDKDCFPASVLTAEHHVACADLVSWKRMPDGCWCGFLPLGCHLLRYWEGTGELYATPLTVVNRDELEGYLQKVKESFPQSAFMEILMGLPMFLDGIVRGISPGAEGSAENGNVGNAVWSHARAGVASRNGSIS